MPEVIETRVALPCDLPCEVYRATGFLLPLAFGIVLLLVGRAASPLTVYDRRLAARAASVIGVGWILVPPIGRANPSLYALLTFLGFGIEAYLVTQFLLETRHRIPPKRYWPLVAALVGTAVIPLVMHGATNPSELALLGLGAACSGALTLGGLALLSSFSEDFPTRFRVEAGLGVVGAAVFLLGLYLA